MSVTGHIIGNWNLSGDVIDGSGTNVVPNPPEEATETLEKIGIDDVVYSITGEQEQADWDQADPTAVDYIKNKPTLSAVATSGSYTDLTDTPTIPAAQVNSDWDAASGVAQILNKPTLSAVATSGDASDVSYDNTLSGMTATDVQDAVDELKSNLTDLIKTLNLGSITTNANGMYIVNGLMFDNAIVLASKGTYGDGFFTEQRPSVNGNVVLKCMDDNNTILKSKTITNVVLYYIEK